MPEHSVHPEREELTAWQAGALADPDGARIAAHLAGCAECAGVVAAVERGRAALSSLPEPELPPGLHERLAAAIERERAAPTRSRVAAARPHGRVLRPRRPAWTGRVAALSAAAALLLLVVGLVPVLRHLGGGAQPNSATMTRSAGGSGAPAPTEAAPLPVFAAPGGYSASALRSGVSADPAVRAAYARAGASDSSGATASPSAGRGSTAAPDAATQGSEQPESRLSAKGTTAAVDQQACLAQVRAAASAQVRPAFFVDTAYRGRPATVLVTRRADSPGQAQLWAFPRGDCSAAPFASEQVKVPPP